MALDGKTKLGKLIRLSIIISVSLLGIFAVINIAHPESEKERFITVMKKLACPISENENIEDVFLQVQVRNIFYANVFPVDDTEKMAKVIDKYRYDTDVVSAISEAIRNCPSPSDSK